MIPLGVKSKCFLIIEMLNLRRPIYRLTSNYGHFGRAGLPWEELDKVEELKKEL